MNDPVETTYVPLATLENLIVRILMREGCSPSTAAIVAANCVKAEAAGSHSHGLFRVDGYVSSLKSGWVNGNALPEIRLAAPGHVAVDARNGFAQVALDAARPLFVDQIKANGISILAITGSHHLGALWPDVLPFADEGLIAISMVNSFACSIPVGAQKPILGTNPIAFAAPIDGGRPFVFDFATSTMANGDVQMAAREGRSLPLGVGVDRLGQPTTDPRMILDGGALVPFGAHKGSAISLMIELLVAGLTGGKFSTEVDWSSHPGAQTPHTGQIVIGLDPGDAHAPFASRSRRFAEILMDAGMHPYPGAKLWDVRDRTNVTIETAQLARLRAQAEVAVIPA